MQYIRLFLSPQPCFKTAYKAACTLFFIVRSSETEYPMPQTYFTADWHFSHPNIARYCPQFRLQSDSADGLGDYHHQQ